MSATEKCFSRCEKVKGRVQQHSAVEVISLSGPDFFFFSYLSHLRWYLVADFKERAASPVESLEKMFHLAFPLSGSLQGAAF